MSKAVSSQDTPLISATTSSEIAALDSRSESATSKEAAPGTERVEAAQGASIDGDDDVIVVAAIERRKDDIKSEEEDKANAPAQAKEDKADAPAQAKKRKKPSAAGTIQKLERASKPRLPTFAFEFYRRREKEKRPKDEKEPRISEMVKRWNSLPAEESDVFTDMADKDRQRFDEEYKLYQDHCERRGKSEPRLQDLVEKRHSIIQKTLTGEGKRKISTAALNKLRPQGYPEAALTSAYGVFCKDRAPELRAAVQAEQAERAPEAPTSSDQQQPGLECQGSAAPDADSEQEEASKKTSSKGSGLKVLKALREQWRGLSAEAKAAYEERVAEDQERFRSEHEAWRESQPDRGLVEEAAFEEAERMQGLKRKRNSSEPRAAKPPRSRRPVLPRERPPTKEPSAQNMGDVLLGTAFMLVEEQKKRRESAAAEQEQGTASRRPAEQPAVEGVSGALRGSLDGVEALPDTSIDDLLGDLAMVEHDQGDGEDDDFSLFGGPEDEGAEDDEQASAPLLPQVPQGAPQALGAQHLCLDESGNIVLNQSSLSMNAGLDMHGDPIEEGVPVMESVSEYRQAYRKTPPCRWTKEETDSFYEALSLYGTDLFLVQTFFRNKSAAQIKSKYKKEEKKNPQLVHEALTEKAQKLTKDTFERLHGKIDTSKHYKPPPSPVPGEERDADGGSPKEDGSDDDLPDFMANAPEPEFAAEDESLTTNRLMALFD